MRTVVVTGAGRNIGLAIASGFAAAGDQVVVNARSADAVERAAAGLVKDGGRAVGIAGDVSRQEDVSRLVAGAEAAFGPVDVLVHCAAVRVHRDFLDMSYEEWRMPFQVGLDAAFYCAQAVLPHMVEQGWGRIIHLGGVTGQTGAPKRASVVATKSGLIGFTKALAHEFADTGVTVNAISPGLIDTERGDWTSLGDQGMTTEHYRGRSQQVPVRRMGRRTEVTAACLYLASDDAGFVTGHTLNVNGGMYMG